MYSFKNAMSVLRRFRKVECYWSLARHLKSLSLGLRSVSSVSVGNSRNEQIISFDDGQRLFASKRTGDIFRAILVLKLCSYEALARNSSVLMSSGRRLLGKTMFEFLLRKSLYSQFVAGESLPDIQAKLKELYDSGIGTMLYVPTEEDLSSDSCDFKAREDMFDRNAAAVMDCIARTEEKGLAQMKITAICSPSLLNELEQLLAPYQTSTKKPVELDIESFAKGYDEKIKLSALTNNQNEHLHNVMRRLDLLARECVTRNVHLVVDAEQTYLQAAINHLVVTLQYKYNKEYARVYNTYQCYRKDTYDRLRADLELMDSLGFHFAGKVVRGAYMEMERSRAAKMGYDDPIHDSYEDTCSMYNNVINTLLQRVQHTPAQVMIASHNEESVAMAIQRMRELDIHPKEHGVSFGQVYGMCDQVTYVLGEQGYNVYKSVPYGPVDSVMAYLGRRANENRDVLKRTEKERSLYQQELKRRMGLLW